MCDAEIGKVLRVKGKKALVEVNGVAKEMVAEFVNVKTNDKILCKGDIIIEKLEE